MEGLLSTGPTPSSFVSILQYCNVTIDGNFNFSQVCFELEFDIFSEFEPDSRAPLTFICGNCSGVESIHIRNIIARVTMQISLKHI